MQGIPGSGKGFVIERDYSQGYPSIHSADNYFRILNENYDNGGEGFDPTKLGEAHKLCFSTFVTALKCDDELIIVDNTNLENEAISPYVAMAQHHAYEVEICRVYCDPDIAEKRNTHGVPKGAYSRLAKAFDNWKQWPPHKYGGVKVRKVKNTPNPAEVDNG